MDVTEFFDAVVTGPTIGHDGGTGFDVGLEGVQRGGRRVRQNHHAAATEALVLFALDRHSDQDLLALCPSAREPRLLAAEVDLVDLDVASAAAPGATSTERSRCNIAHAVA